MNEKIKILWLYPSVLNLHGNRGDLMALSRIGKMIGLEVEILRIEAPDEPLPLDDADMVFLCPGQVADALRLADKVDGQALAAFAQRGGHIIAIGSSGCMLARETTRYDGSVCRGLGLLPMVCKERDAVYGDDIWFTTDTGIEILGNQIQVADTVLDEDAVPYGTVIYGHGNNKSKDEGCRRDNIIFTNALGPMLVKNPRLTQELLNAMACRKGIAPKRQLSAEDTDYEDKSAELIRAFIKKKMA